MCVFLSFFPFLLDRVRSRACVKSDKRTHAPHSNPPLKSHQRKYTTSTKNHRTEFFFFFTEAKKLTTALKKKRERGSNRDRRKSSTLRDETESAQCTPCGKKKLPVSLTSHRKQPHRTGCESTRHHANNTARTEGVIPVQKQMHTASSSDVKTTCRSLRFRPHAADRVSFLRKLVQQPLHHSTTATKPRAFGKPHAVPVFTTKPPHGFKGKESKYGELYTFYVSKSSKGGGSEKYYVIFKPRCTAKVEPFNLPTPLNGLSKYATLLKSGPVETQYNIPSLAEPSELRISCTID